GLWQPVFFHGSNSWVEKIVGGWSLSGVFTTHSGFPWSPVVSVNGGSLYCGTCGYGSIFPIYNGGAGSNYSNQQFKTGSNFANGPFAYFTTPNYTAYSGTTFGNSQPQIGLVRNTFIGPGYRDVDATLTKAFGLPKAPIIGENARLELRANFFNLFNNLNFNPGNVSNNIGTPATPNTSFGQIDNPGNAVLSGRVITLDARFSF